MSHLLHSPLQLARKLFEEDPPATLDAAVAMILTDRARTCEVLTSALREYREGDIGDMLDLLKELRDKYVSGSMQEPLGLVQEERDVLADEALKLQNYMLEHHPEEEAQPGSLVDAAIRVMRRGSVRCACDCASCRAEQHLKHDASTGTALCPVGQAAEDDYRRAPGDEDAQARCT